MNKILFIIGFTLYVLLILCSCRSIKNLTKTIDKSLEKKNLTVSVDSVGVKTDTSKFNTEIVIDYCPDSMVFESTGDSGMGHILLGEHSDIATDPFPSVHTTQKIKRIIIKTKQDFHVKDSSVVRSSQIDNSKTKTVKTDIVKSKKTTSYWWLLLLLIPVLYLLYEKYKTKLSWILK